MKRKVIRIDEDKCNGCGLCIPECPEGAIQVIDGKARLISDLFCDGLGACLGHCPQDAITIEEREAERYDERKVMENVIKGGENVIKAHLDHLREHGQTEYLHQAVQFLQEKGLRVHTIPAARTHETEATQSHTHSGCPGAKAMDFRGRSAGNPGAVSAPAAESQLRQWPVQLQLLNPRAPYFEGADLLITADCVPFANADFHEKFLKGRILVIFCPKLDKVIDEYVEKLTVIFSLNDIKSITVVHMEVPCCFGLNRIVEEALRRSGKSIKIEDRTISIAGEVS